MQIINKMEFLLNYYPCFVLNNHMDLLDQLRAFVATAHTGSFTAAADHLGTSNRLTSKYVAELETRLGVRLFQRTTRKVGLTPAGEDLLAKAPTLLDEFDDLLSEISESSRGFGGIIRVSAPVTFGELYVVGMMGRFAEANPGLTVDLRLSDSYTDLAADGIDLAFRMGQPDLLSLKARKLGVFRSVAVASPDYLSRYGTPETPALLSDHECIIDTNRRAPRRWAFQNQGQALVVDVRGRFQVNSARGAAELAAKGMGIAYAPRFALSDALENGSLLPLFEDFTGEAAPLSAVYLEGRALPHKVRSLIDFAVQDFRSANVL